MKTSDSARPRITYNARKHLTKISKNNVVCIDWLVPSSDMSTICFYPGVASSILARSHTFVETDHEVISTVFLLPPAESFKKACCQLQAKVCARSTG